jgi:hypothetical protein
MGVKAPAVDALSTDVGVVNPRVVVGVTPSDPPPSTSEDSMAPPSLEARGTVDGVTPSSLPSSVPPSVTPSGVDPLAALETLEKVTLRPGPAEASEAPEMVESLSSTVVLGSQASEVPVERNAIAPREGVEETTEAFASPLALGSVVEPAAPAEEPAQTAEPARELEPQKPDFASTLAFGSTGSDLAAEDAAASSAPAAIPEPLKVVEAPLPEPKKVDAESVERAEASDEAPASHGKKGKKNKKKASKVEEVEAAGSRDPDEVSVPPIGDLAVDEQFFSEGDVSRLVGDALEGEALTVPDKARRKAEPHVVERRARFVRYVKWAVAGAAVVCLAAVARTTLSAKPSSVAVATRSAAVVAEAPAAPKAATPAAAPVAEPTTTATATATAENPSPTPAPTPAEPETAPAAAAATGAAASAAAAEPSPTEVKSEPVTGDAKEEKTKARTLLEKRKLGDAIEAGERSVKLDPTDGEAWLILGAAYQEKGNMVEARRAYTSCVKDAQTGPRAECAKMLR